MEEKYFYGNKISNYGLERGYVDYRTLAKAFDAVLNNQIISHGVWNIISGLSDNEYEILQYYIVSDIGSIILQEAGEIVYYNAEFDMYLWGVTHYGTAWDEVLTSIKIDW